MRIAILSGEGDLEECRRIRRKVFIDEQRVAENEEWDGLDAECVHFLAAEVEPLGTARLRITAEGQAKAERVAVLATARRRGIGAALMLALEGEAARRGHRSIALGAQLHAVPFYRRLGYEAHGPEFDEAGIPHRRMTKELPCAQNEPG